MQETYTFQFTAKQIDEINSEAKLRQQAHRGYKTYKYTSRSDDLGIHALGVAGELAVAWLLGIDIEREYSALGGDKVADLKYNGKSIQVKTRMWRKNPDLFFTQKSGGLFADYAFLMSSEIPIKRCRFEGFISKSDFQRMKHEKTYTKVKNWAVFHSQLTDIRQFIKPTKPCFVCSQCRFDWASVGLKWICQICHPFPS